MKHSSLIFFRTLAIFLNFLPLNSGVYALAEETPKKSLGPAYDAMISIVHRLEESRQLHFLDSNNRPISGRAVIDSLDNKDPSHLNDSFKTLGPNSDSYKQRTGDTYCYAFFNTDRKIPGKSEFYRQPVIIHFTLGSTHLGNQYPLQMRITPVPTVPGRPKPGIASILQMRFFSSKENLKAAPNRALTAFEEFRAKVTSPREDAPIDELIQPGFIASKSVINPSPDYKKIKPKRKPQPNIQAVQLDQSHDLFDSEGIRESGSSI